MRYYPEPEPTLSLDDEIRIRADELRAMQQRLARESREKEERALDIWHAGRTR